MKLCLETSFKISKNYKIFRVETLVMFWGIDDDVPLLYLKHDELRPCNVCGTKIIAFQLIIFLK